MSNESDKLPPPSAVFSDFIAKGKSVKAPKSKQREVINPSSPSPRRQLVNALKVKSIAKTDFAPYYKPSENFYGSASGEDQRPSLADLAAIGQVRMGCVWMATAEIAGDVVRNWHSFVDPDRPDKPIKDDATKAIFKFVVKTDLKNASHQWVRWERLFGTSFLVKYWTNKDKDTMHEPAPFKPPRKFRAFSPRFMTPINLNSSNELNYQEELWKFSGGIFAKFAIHQDRVDVLTTRPEEGNWRGLSLCEPVWIPLMGYFNNFIYIVKAYRRWGDQVPVMHSGDTIPDAEEIDDILDLMDQFEANMKWAVGKDDKIEFIQTKIGSGIKESMEMFKEELSCCWRIPLNQMFGRSVGGGLQRAGALVSKEDKLQNDSNIQMSITDNIKKIYTDAGFEVEQWDLLWNMAVKKTDEQLAKEEGMQTQNKILAEQLKSQKLQNKLLAMQVEQAQWQGIMPEEEGAPGEGGESSPGETEEGESQESDEPREETDSKLTDMQKKRRKGFWNSIHIENHIQFPYGDARK